MTLKKNKHIVFLGLRGFPNVQGGVETHCENLAPILVNNGFKVTIITRSPFHKHHDDWAGVSFLPIWSPKINGFEAFIHSFIGTIVAIFLRPDILHIHAIGPAFFTPLARIFGLKVVVTHHGFDYEREKWGWFAQWILRSGERFSVNFSNCLIVISKVISDSIRDRYSRKVQIIPNGVKMPHQTSSSDILDRFKLKKNKYILFVGRLVQEKRQLDLINAFNSLNLQDWKLVIVGGSDHPNEYELNIYKEARKNCNIVMAGFQKGSALNELYSNASFFVLPSSHEGLPIVMLEALSYGLPVIASDIPANLEVGLDKNCYYPMGDIQKLSSLILMNVNNPLFYLESEKEKLKNWVTKKYNWLEVANKTIKIYQKILNSTRSDLI